MAISKCMITLLLIVSVLLLHHATAAFLPHQLVTGNVIPGNADVGEQIDCGAACDARCELSSRPNLCLRACGTCCVRCKCVPPGTSGNYDACPCYGNMKTRGNKPKCP